MISIINNNLIYGDFKLDKLGVVEEVDRPVSPEIRINSKELSGRNGEVYKNKKYASLFIDIYVRVFSYRNLNKLISTFMSYLHDDKLRPLNYKRNKSWYDATLSSCEISEKYRNQRALLKLTFYVPSGYARSRYMRDDYKNFTNQKIVLSGNMEVIPIFYFKGSSNKITNTRTGEFIRITGRSTYDYIIDHERNYIYKESIEEINLMKNLSWDSRFFTIKDGDTITADNPVSLKFYERFLYDE